MGLASTTGFLGAGLARGLATFLRGFASASEPSLTLALHVSFRIEGDALTYRALLET